MMITDHQSSKPEKVSNILPEPERKKKGLVQNSLYRVKVNLIFHLEISVLESSRKVECLKFSCEIAVVCDDLGHYVIC